MYPFWDGVIQPLLQTVHATTIVEIGSDDGTNTLNLLAYAESRGGTVHVIDPFPRYDPDEWVKRYGTRLVYHNEPSLTALPHIDTMDAVLIDGDHNWYTVYNELKLIEKNAKEAGRDLPLILLHDIGWPYGRRDMYYAPETIPHYYRKPYAKKGMLPQQSALIDEGGLNASLPNATYEGGSRNGVLTAVEDFIAESGGDYALVGIPAIFGLGVLYSKTLVDVNPGFAEWVQSISAAKCFWPILETTERERVDRQLVVQSQKQVLRKKSAAEAAARREVLRLRRELEEKTDALAELRQETLHLHGCLQNTLGQLQSDTGAIMYSLRWRIGNTIVRIVEAILLRGRPLLAIDHMRTSLVGLQEEIEQRSCAIRKRTTGDTHSEHTAKEGQ